MRLYHDGAETVTDAFVLTRFSKGLFVVLVTLMLLASCLAPVFVAAASAQIQVTTPNAQAGGAFGFSVAVSGDTLVVGAPYENATGQLDAGNAYVFNSATGALVSTLVSPDVQAGGAFGSSVAVGGGTVVVGAPNETSDGYPEAGNAYVFNASTGALISTLTAPDPQYYGLFGWSVAVSGGRVVVGAYYESSGGNAYTGSAYVFNAVTGALVSTLATPSAQPTGWFGYSVAVSGSTVVVGAPNETGDGYSSAGDAYVFNAVTGALVSNLTSPDAQYYGLFGWSVAVSGSTVVVGAPNEGSFDAGDAYVFNASTGALVSNFTSPNAQTSGFLGGSVAVSGSTAIVGAFGETAGGYSSAGNSYVFDAVTGALISNLTSPDAHRNGPNGLFGFSVAVSGNTIVVGAPGETAGGYSSAGNAYILSASQTSTTTSSSSATSSSTTISSSSEASSTATSQTSTTIPEFPGQLDIALLAAAAAVVASYSVLRRVKTPKT